MVFSERKGKKHYCRCERWISVSRVKPVLNASLEHPPNRTNGVLRSQYYFWDPIRCFSRSLQRITTVCIRLANRQPTPITLVQHPWTISSPLIIYVCRTIRNWFFTRLFPNSQTRGGSGKRISRNPRTAQIPDCVRVQQRFMPKRFERFHFEPF